MHSAPAIAGLTIEFVDMSIAERLTRKSHFEALFRSDRSISPIIRNPVQGYLRRGQMSCGNGWGFGQTSSRTSLIWRFNDAARVCILRGEQQ
jgi:hypothetical protein